MHSGVLSAHTEIETETNTEIETETETEKETETETDIPGAHPVWRQEEGPREISGSIFFSHFQAEKI